MAINLENLPEQTNPNDGWLFWQLNNETYKVKASVLSTGIDLRRLAKSDIYEIPPSVFVDPNDADIQEIEDYLISQPLDRVGSFYWYNTPSYVPTNNGDFEYLIFRDWLTDAIIIREPSSISNLSNSNLIQKDEPRTYNGNGGELTFQNISVFQLFQNSVDGNSVMVMDEGSVGLSGISYSLSFTNGETIVKTPQEIEDVVATNQITTKDYVKSLNTWQATQWSASIPNTIVGNNGTQNLFDLLDNADKTGISSTDASAIDIITDATGNYLEPTWLGLNEKLSIRVILGIDQGGTDFYRVRLRRKSDDSIISVHPFSINSGDIPEKSATVLINTYINSPTDPFLNGGFYIDFANNSGATSTLQNNVNILIFREFQNLLF